jgi:hypothetical protein
VRRAWRVGRPGLGRSRLERRLSATTPRAVSRAPDVVGKDDVLSGMETGYFKRSTGRTPSPKGPVSLVAGDLELITQTDFDDVG